MKMLAPELSSATVFWSQIEKKNRQMRHKNINENGNDMLIRPKKNMCVSDRPTLKF